MSNLPTVEQVDEAIETARWDIKDCVEGTALEQQKKEYENTLACLLALKRVEDADRIHVVTAPSSMTVIQNIGAIPPAINERHLAKGDTIIILPKEKEGEKDAYSEGR